MRVIVILLIISLSLIDGSFYFNNRDARYLRRLERDVARRHYYRKYHSLFSSDFGDYSNSDNIIVMNNIGFYQSILLKISHIIVMIVSVFIIVKIFD
jgi:hypothetical protein